MNLESIGTGVGGSVVTAMLTWLGFKQRLDAADKKIATLAASVVYKDAHEICSCSWHMSLEALNKKHDETRNETNRKLDYIITRIDKTEGRR